MSGTAKPRRSVARLTPAGRLQMDGCRVRWRSTAATTAVSSPTRRARLCLLLAMMMLLGVMNITPGRSLVRHAGASDATAVSMPNANGDRLAVHVAIEVPTAIEGAVDSDPSSAVMQIVVDNRNRRVAFRGGEAEVTLTNHETSQFTVDVPSVVAGDVGRANLSLPRSALDPARAPLSYRVRIHEVLDDREPEAHREAAEPGQAADAAGGVGEDVAPSRRQLIADASGSLMYGPRWLILGPFEHSGRTEGGFDERFGPEVMLPTGDGGSGAAGEPGGADSNADTAPARLVDPGEAYARDPSAPEAGALRWRPLPADIIRQPDGYRDFREMFGERNNVTIYAATTLVSDVERDVVLRIGSDDAVKVWLNGVQVHANNLLRGSTPGQDEVPIRLRAGENEVLLKIVQWGGWYGFHFDVADPQGNAVPETAVRVPEGWMIDRPALPDLTITEMRSRGPILRWYSDDPAPTAIVVQRATHARFDPALGVDESDAMLTPAPGAPALRLVGSPILRTEHEMLVTDLDPGTRYIAWAEETNGGGPSGGITFTTPAEAGEMQYLRLRLVNLIFTNVTEEGHAETPGADVPMPDDQVNRIIDEMNENAMFYWINSGMKVWLDMTNLRYDGPLTIAADTRYGYSYNDGKEYEILDEVLAARGEKGSDYDGVNFVSVDKRFEDEAWVYPASGGGTLGPLPPYNIGKSGWKGGCDNAWLFCHEFGHQLDALFAHSGGGGDAYLFNHFQPWDGTAHRHGEHWDGNAWLLREWGGHVDDDHQHMNRFQAGLRSWRYLTCRWGEIVTTADRDMDGVPDADPQVPLDEQRFGSSPDHVDTDRDGLPDLGEAMVRTFTTLGLNEYFADSPHRAARMDPAHPDSDGDGLVDGVDPEPLYAMRCEIPLLSAFDFDGDPAELPMLLAIADPAFAGEVRLGRTATHLVIGVSARDRLPASVQIMIDLDDDGWYVGRDNLHIRLHAGGQAWIGGARKRAGADFASVELNNCGIPDRYPFFDPDALVEDEIEARERRDDAAADSTEGRPAWSAEVRVPVNAAYGFENRLGERIGLLVGFEPAEGIGRPGRQQRMLTVFEPHSFVSLELRAADLNVAEPAAKSSETMTRAADPGESPTGAAEAAAHGGG